MGRQSSCEFISVGLGDCDLDPRHLFLGDPGSRAERPAQRPIRREDMQKINVESL